MNKAHVSRGLIALIGGGLLVVAGCRSRESTSAERRADDFDRTVNNELGRGGGPRSVNLALDQISRERCAREARCQNVGEGRHFASEAACLSAMRAQYDDGLNLRDCSRGIDASGLTHCLAEIRNENCGNPIDSLERATACRSGAVCVH
jgi:hypothetical protein